MTDSYDYREYQPAFAGPTVVELSIPSGKVIASDDLREPKYFNLEDDSFFEGAFGCDVWARDFAEKVNVGYAFVGNTCPSVTLKNDGIFRVVSGEYDEDNYDKSPFEDDETILAPICTDHWATMITDYQNWLEHGGIPIEKANDGYSLQKFTVFDVKPGKYRWTVYSHSDGFRNHSAERIVYAQLELIEAY
jgi:hypothetical protein